MFYRGNNQALITQLKRLQHESASVSDISGFERLMDSVKQFPGSYQFHYRSYWVSLAMIAIVGSALTFYDWQRLQHMQGSSWLLVAVSVAALLLVLGLMIYPWQLLRSVSARLLQQDALLDNDIKPVSFHSPALTRELLSRFNEFHRGNYRREVKALYEGRFDGDEYAFDYRYLHFHYVDERIVIETYTNSKGQVRTRRRKVYDHYDRYALIMPFQFVRDVAVVSFANSLLSGSTYKPASNRFNERFRVIAGDELTAAKTMKPTVVVALEEVGELLSKPNLEFNGSADLCLSFADNDMIKTPSKVTLSDFTAFIEAIEGQQSFAKLQRTLQSIHYLMTKLDNNF